MINHTSVFLRCIFYIASLLWLLTSLFIEYSPGMRNLILLTFIIGTLAYISCTRCPHCHRLGVGVKLFSDNAGYCRRCGKLVEYDD